MFCKDNELSLLLLGVNSEKNIKQKHKSVTIMTKIFGLLISAVALFGAVSCSEPETNNSVNAGELVTTTLTVDLANLGSRIAGQSEMIDKVAYGVYDVSDNGRFLEVLSSAHAANGPVDFKNGQATVNITLFKGKTYDFVFFAYCSSNNAYSIDWANRVLNVSYADATDAAKGDLANLEARDAFFHVEQDFVAGSDATFTLKRPFAQLNVGQSYEDYNNMQKTGNCILKSSLTTKAYTQMSLGRDTYGSVLGQLTDVTFELNNVIDIAEPAGNDDLEVVLPRDTDPTLYKHLSMNYLLVKNEELINAKVSLLGNEGTLFVRDYANVPVQRNHRTNIIGNIISDEYAFTVLIDKNFINDKNFDEEQNPIQ